MVDDLQGLSRDDLEAYYRLRDLLHATGGAAIAFSGGVDSTLLLDVAKGVLGMRTMAITAVSPLFPKDEQDFAESFAGKNRIRQIKLKAPDLSSPCFAQNPPDRCYHCKKQMFERAREEASRYSMKLVDAANVDDLAEYRPGMKAASELEVLSPLLEAGFDKARIRRVAKERGLPNWNAPSQACLATRFPVGTALTEDLLDTVYRAERAIKDLGFSQVRVRCHNGLARLEVGEDEMEKLLEKETRQKVHELLLKEGFAMITADLGGYQSGSMNPAQS